MVRPKKYKRPHEFTKKVNAYFENKDNIPFTVLGLCLYLDIHRSTLIEYEAIPKFSNTIKKAKARIEDHTHKLALQNGYNSTIAIFTLKNNFGWKDEKEIKSKNETTHKHDFSNMTDEELLAFIEEE